MKEKLHILFICNKSPWPASEGGPIAMLNLIEGLCKAGHNVKVLAVNTNKYHIKPQEIPENFIQKTGLELIYVDLSVKPIPAAWNLLMNRSYHVQRFISVNFKKKLIQVLKATKFDIVQVELVFMSPYLRAIRQYSEAKVILRAHNIEHFIWEGIAEKTESWLKRFYLRQLVRTLRNYELSVLDSYDGIIPITQKDADFFKKHCHKPVIPISFGINIESFGQVTEQAVENALFHIGSMNWIPNEEGIKWFLNKVWPMLHHELPSLKIYLAGREMPDWLVNLKMENVNIVGEVQDAAAFIKSKAICIAPLLSGSGIRIKIIESMALGKPVVSTSIGAEGINYTHGVNILISDSPENFSEAIRFLFSNPTKAEKMGRMAQQLIEKDHSTDKIIENLVSFYREIL